MPIIDIKLIQGYAAEARQRLAQRVTDATTSVIDAPADLVTVTISEIAPENYMRGRTMRQPGPAIADQSAIVLEYLQAMEARDLDRARGFLAEGFSMTFPGNVTFHKLEELVSWASGRYSSVGKTIEATEECLSDSGSVVYCYGSLHGTWLNGTSFSDIRFIDRFTLNSSKISEQRVWNDLAESASRPG